MGDIAIATILGVIEGLTEYLPISSTGHMILAGHFLGFEGERAATFEIFIQLGAILAVLLMYLSRFQKLLAFGSKDGFAGTKGIVKIGVASLPALVVGAIAHGFIKARLFNPSTVVLSLIMGGIVLLFAKERRSTQCANIESLSLKQAFLIGIFQLFSLCPGVSRSGATIVGGMMAGCSKKVAAEFSFIVAVPIMIAAVGYDLLKSFRVIQMSDIPFFAVGFLVAFITAMIAIKFFLQFLEKHSLALFGVYRIVLGVLVMLWVGG